MQIKASIHSLTRIIALLSIAVFVFTSCSDPEPEPEPFQVLELTASPCGCNYTVPASANSQTVDGQKLGIKPGNVICLTGGAQYANIVFKNLHGTAASPVVIRNCGGVATLNSTGKPYGLKTETSSFVRITGESATPYGIRVSGGHMSVTFEKLSTNIEMDHAEVFNSGFSGFIAKTDPTCDNATIRGNFVMRDVRLHDNYVHDTAGEGFYIGHSSWTNGVSTTCGTRYPHAMEGVKIYNNIIRNSGWESIQVGSAPNGAEVYNNRIENYGTRNAANQNNGVQFGEGATGSFYGNFIKGGKGHGLIIIGNGQNFVHDNVIVNAGIDGIFCDDRVTGPGFKFINNTIINPAMNGIRLYADEVTMNYVLNNIVVNPGNYSKLTYPRTGNDAYLYLLSSAVKVQKLNNFYTRNISDAKFVSASTDNYGPTSASTNLVNKGTSISAYNITLDFVLKPRVKSTVDIGAYELQ